MTRCPCIFLTGIGLESRLTHLWIMQSFKSRWRLARRVSCESPVADLMDPHQWDGAWCTDKVSLCQLVQQRGVLCGNIHRQKQGQVTNGGKSNFTVRQHLNGILCLLPDSGITTASAIFVSFRLVISSGKFGHVFNLYSFLSSVFSHVMTLWAWEHKLWTKKGFMDWSIRSSDCAIFNILCL